MQAVTIAARNYLPFARLLARSFIEHNLSSSFVILVVDALPGELSAEDGYTIATPAELPMEPDEFRRMAMIYDVTELSTSLKPWALEMLLDRGAEVAVYLDPDIIVYDDLGEIEALAKQHSTVLTPHTLTSMQRDSLRPTEADIMGSGIYNLGFIAVDSRRRDLLGWWQERLLRDSISAPELMLFTDQRWIDFVPSLFDHVILRDPGYNVAYWNIDGRTVEDRDGRIVVNGRPLRFFHFSGYRPERPWVLSKYVADRPRVLLSEQPVVRRLCDAYGVAALAEGMTAVGATPYRFAQMAIGVDITGQMRRVYRDALVNSEKEGTEKPPAPFTPEGDAALLAWFREPVREGHVINRALLGIWSNRPDLRAHFPQPLGTNEADLLTWARTSGVAEGTLVPEVLPSETAPPARTWVGSVEPGANVSGYLTAELGVGRSGRLVVEALRASGLPFSTSTFNRTVSRRMATFTDVDPGLRYPVNIAVVNADQIGLWARDVGPELLDGRWTIGVWAWEVEEFPIAQHAALDLVDEVWAVSTFVRDAIAKVTSKPVHVFPNPVPEPAPAEPLDRAVLGLPADRPMFLFAFDYLSVFERKNPLALVEAFRRAFDHDDGPILVIKTINGDKCRSDRERLRAACIDHADIYVIEDYLGEESIKSLMADATAYVSLHRSEGYGLTMAEAMALGVPVIATGYSGNLDFMTATDSLLVPYESVPVAPGAGPYPVTTDWAEPDVAVAAEYMRRVCLEPEFATEIGRRGREAVLARCGLEASAEFVRRRVTEAAMGVVRPTEGLPSIPGPVLVPAGDALEHARGLIRTPLRNDTPSRMPKSVARVLRSTVSRLLRHHDQEVNLRLEALAAAVEISNRDVQADQELSAVWAAETSNRLDRTFQRVDRTAQRVDRTAQRVDRTSGRVEHLASRVAGHDDMFVDVSGRLDATTARTQQHDAELAARPFTLDPDQVIGRDASGRRALVLAPGDDGSYASFEDVFRGPEDFVADRLQPYVSRLADCAPVLDIGCGRGEMLELLTAAGFRAQGIELDESMFARCVAKGLDVTRGDAIEEMERIPAGSLGAVTSFQVVEHLELFQLRSLLAAAYRVLRPGGLFLAETVNPHSPSALKTFWLDLTHIRPLFPESMLFLAREMGFEDAHIVFPFGGHDLDVDLRSCGEYALVAKKSANEV